MVTGIRNEEAPPWSNEPLPRMAHCDSGSLQLCGHHVLTNTQIQIHQSKYKYTNPITNTSIQYKYLPLPRIVYNFHWACAYKYKNPFTNNISTFTKYFVFFFCCKKWKLGRNQECKYLSRLRQT